jgi:TolA-binding protein
MREPTKVSAFVFPELGNGRIDAQWSRIAEQLPVSRLEGSRSMGRVSRPLMGAFAAVCVLAFVWVQRPVVNTTESSVWEGSVVASDESPVNVTLAEGTLIELDPRSEVALMHSSPEAVHVALSDGSAHFEVAKKRSRRFRVQMGAVEVLVTGTQFRVARSVVEGGERVRVDVEEGSVEVNRKGVGAVRLQAGDHWSAFVAKTDQVREEQLEKEGGALPVGPAVTPSTNEQAQADEGEDEAAEGEAEESSGHSVRRGRGKAHERAQAAEELFAQANVARRAGLVTESAKLYGELVARHPRDHKAALAAFELGRLRMDSLSDVPGAVDALERALKLDARRAFAEDALARLVLAHEALGDRAACTRARARYLGRYPEGVHAQHVAARCGAI